MNTLNPKSKLPKVIIASALACAGLSAHAFNLVGPKLVEPEASDTTTSVSNVDSTTGSTAPTPVGEITPEMRTQVMVEAQRALHRLNTDIQSQLEQSGELTTEKRQALADADRNGRDAIARELDFLRLQDADLDPSRYFWGGVVLSWELKTPLKKQFRKTKPEATQISVDTAVKGGFAVFNTVDATGPMRHPVGLRIAPLVALKGDVRYGKSYTSNKWFLGSKIRSYLPGEVKVSLIYFSRSPNKSNIGNLQDAAGLYYGVGAEWSTRGVFGKKDSEQLIAKMTEAKRLGFTLYVKSPVTPFNRLGEFTSWADFVAMPKSLPGVYILDLNSGVAGVTVKPTGSVGAQYIKWVGSNNGDGYGFDAL